MTHSVVHSVEKKTGEDQTVSIRDLKAMGLVGERFDGYIGIVVPEVDEDIQQRIDQMNIERRQQYEKISAQIKETTLADVEKKAGKAFIDRERMGFFIQIEGHGWKKK